MNELVFLAPTTREAFTTSDVVAELTGNDYRSVQRIIEKQKRSLEAFGLVRFEITPIETKKGIRNKKVYHLNEPQATLLITFLKNTPVVVAFKTELVKQFYQMRLELERINAVKVERKSIRKSMTDEIKALPDSPHKSFKYAQYSDLSYRVALGKSARQIRQERGAKRHDTASNYLMADELAAVASAENKIAVLLSLGYDYQQIKAAMLKPATT